MFSSAHWQVYRVLGATSLLRGPGRLTALGHQGFTLDASAPGDFLVRVHYTPYWTVLAGRAHISEAQGNWTQIIVSRAGVVRVQAQFSLGAALEALARL